jgi:hypothetical protein
MENLQNRLAPGAPVLESYAAPTLANLGRLSLSGIRPHRYATIALAVVSAAAVACACLALFISVDGRGIQINQAQFLLIAQQWLSGRRMYLDLGDIHPPPMHMLSATVVLLADYTGWSYTFAFNFFCNALVLLSGVLFGLASPRFRVVAGSFWICALVFTANDIVFADRDYLFMIGWVPYLLARTALRQNHSVTMVASGALAGYLICIKPHFLVIFAGTELWLLVAYHKKCPLLPLAAMILSGLLQLAIFVAFFDVKAYIDAFSVFDYYGVNGFHRWQTFLELLTTPYVYYGIVVSLVCPFLLPRSSPLRRLAEAVCATVITAVAMLVLHGAYRFYYAALFFLPAAGLLITCVVSGPREFVGDSLVRKAATFLLVCVASVAFFAKMTGNGIRIQARLHYLDGIETVAFGNLRGDPFMAYVEKNVPESAGIYTFGDGPGVPFGDPIVSMVRMKRPVPSKYPGLDYDLTFAAATRNTTNAIKATERLRFDLDNYADWFVTAGAIGLLRNYPAFWSWFEQNFHEVDRFDRYVVYRRTSVRNTKH